MRELRFRAWGDKINPQYQGDKEMEYFNFDEWRRRWRGSICSVQIMQYTGLKDKTGKEIYEGDIVECGLATWSGWPAPREMEVKYHDGGFIPFVSSSSGPDNMDPESCKIIGNIYETPELLK